MQDFSEESHLLGNRKYREEYERTVSEKKYYVVTSTVYKWLRKVVNFECVSEMSNLLIPYASSLQCNSCVSKV